MPGFGAVLFAKQVGPLSAFYSSLFNLSVIVKEPDKVVLAADDFTLTIHGIPSDIAKTISISAPPELRDSTPIKLCFQVNDLNKTREHATRLGGKLFAHDKAWENAKFVACDGYDPEGNIFQAREFKPQAPTPKN